MPPVSELLIGGVLPGVIALVLLGVPWVVFRDRAAGVLRWVAPWAVGLAFIPASIVSNKHANLWPVNASERGLAVLVVSLGLVMLMGVLGTGRLGLWGKRAGLAMPASAGAFGAYAVLVALHPHAVSTALLIGVAAGAGVWTVSASMLLGWSERASPGYGTPGMLAIALLGCSLVMLFSAIGVYAQATGGLVAAMSSAAILGLWKRRATLGVGAYAVALSVLAYLLVGTWQLSARPAIGALVLCAALPFVAAGCSRIALGGAGRRLVAWIAVVAMTAGAAGWAFALYSAAKDTSPYGY